MVSLFHTFRNRKVFQLAGLLALMILVLAACQPAAAPTQQAAAPTETTAPMATATMATVPNTAGVEAELSVVNDPKLGKILVGNNGMTVYMFTKDTANKSNCEGGCLANWPPLITQGSPKLGEGVDPALVGTAEMADGKKIVTYNKMPLYYWAKDTKAGDTTGQGVGDVWYVVSPDGKVIGMDAPAAEPTVTTAPAASTEAEISVAEDMKLGKILVGAKGMTLYMFTKDEANKSNCNEACLAKWPPLLTEGSPKLGAGVDAKLVGSADLADGKKIVTYNGMPLYYWVKDTKAGDTTGQGVGDVWYVVSPDGKPVGMTEKPAAATGDISVADDPKLGKILVGANGMTLYMFTKDEPNKSNCDDACLAKWPPLVVEGTPTLGEGVDAKLVGTADLPDGKKIVTYNGMPLYYWVNDKKAGDTTGQGVGDVWYVVSPDGKKVDNDAASASAGQTASTGAEINVAEDAKLGKILVGANGMTLYMFTKDEANKSNCNDACLAKWPPLVVEGTPKLGEGVDPKLVGTADLADGKKIVTYNGMPLYYWVNDKKAGDTTGQGVGSVWYVVTPDGKAVEQ